MEKIKKFSSWKQRRVRLGQDQEIYDLSARESKKTRSRRSSLIALFGKQEERKKQDRAQQLDIKALDGRCYIELLPSELLSTIFNLLHVDEMLLCCQVSKYWNALITSDSQFWKKTATVKWKFEPLQLCCDSWKEVLKYYNTKVARRVINQTKSRSHVNISWNGMNLCALPASLFTMNRLKVLDLTGNFLQFLPRAIRYLSSLQVLYLGNNRFSIFPDDILSLKQLKELYLYGNQLTHIPPGISQLQHLTVLALSQNKLTCLPPQIVSLTNLKTLTLFENPFRRYEEIELILMSLGL